MTLVDSVLLSLAMTLFHSVNIQMYVKNVVKSLSWPVINPGMTLLLKAIGDICYFLGFVRTS